MMVPSDITAYHRKKDAAEGGEAEAEPTAEETAAKKSAAKKTTTKTAAGTTRILRW